MAQGFYELLGVTQAAPADDVRNAYQKRLGELVRSLQAARKNGADTTVLEGQERVLREAAEVLSDPTRRRRYDAFRSAVEKGLPETPEELWERVRPVMVDPATMAALSLVRGMTGIAIARPLPEAPPAYRAVGPAIPDRVIPDYTDARGSKNPMPALLPPPERGLATYMEASPVRVEVNDSDTAAMPSPTMVPAIPVDEVVRLADRYGHDGRFLSGVREHRGLTIDALAERTKISLRYLHALEDNDYNGLPAATFVRGYLKEIGRVLAVDPGALVDGYMALFTHHRG